MKAVLESDQTGPLSVEYDETGVEIATAVNGEVVERRYHHSISLVKRLNASDISTLCKSLAKGRYQIVCTMYAVYFENAEDAAEAVDFMNSIGLKFPERRANTWPPPREVIEEAYGEDYHYRHVFYVPSGMVSEAFVWCEETFERDPKRWWSSPYGNRLRIAFNDGIAAMVFKMRWMG